MSRDQCGPTRRLISYEELKTHSSYSDAWISINGTVYDITKFVDNHPFGDTFRGNLGAECGGLFSASHVNTNVEKLIKNPDFLKHHNIKIVGRLDVRVSQSYQTGENQFLDRIVYQDTEHDEFWIELRESVGAYLKANGETTHFSVGEGVAYIVYYLAGFALLSYLTWIEASAIAAILLGIHMICALANISHMATHFGFTRSHLLNMIATHFFDLAGMSGLEWQITHQTHHNQPHSSIDHQTNVYDYIAARIHKFKTRRPHHNYQRYYFWLTISAYLGFKFIAISVWMIANRQYLRHGYEIVAHLFARGILVGLVVACAYLHGFWVTALMVTLYSISYSQTAFILLFNDHEDTHAVLSDNEDVSCYHHKMSWAEVQVRTSNNWYPTGWLSTFFEFHFGYFNYHIEHHLFPALKPTLLKRISPIVRGVCRKHNIPYTSTPFMAVQKSFQRHIIQMGLP